MNETIGIFSQFERDELNKITSKSILEKLMNIRQKIDVGFIARRLIWELIQNAKDNVALCNSQGEKVDVTIELAEDQFVFSHNKGFFNNEHIRGLIRKYSSSDKERDTETLGQRYKTTGRFGTGFMTTHLLSEKVKVESFYKNEDQTFNSFSFFLDRTGKTEAKIIDGINNAFNEAERSINSSNPINATKDQFKTSFIYPLTEPKYKLASIAIEEAKNGIAYTLINVPEVSTVTFVEEIIGAITYQIQYVETLSGESCEFEIYNLIVDQKPSKHFYLSSKNKDVRIILPIGVHEGQYYSEELNSSIPRLHLDFPMIGTEGLSFPFIINSPLFEPTEPRDGVSLIDDEDNEISQMNCGQVLNAVGMYKAFLSYISTVENWHDLYNLARIKYPQKYPWIDSAWFHEKVVESIRTKLLYSPIVDVVSGDRVSIWNIDNEAQVYFPYSEIPEIRKKVWELAKELFPAFIPIEEHIDYWNEIIWPDCFKFSISNLSEEIQNCVNVSQLGLTINNDDDEALDFLNRYYSLLNLEGIHIKGILADEFKVIPNQNGIFTRKSELCVDKGIDEELKHVCSIITKDPKEYLIQIGATTGSGILYAPKEQKHIIEEINSVIKEGKHDKIPQACDYLVSLFAENGNPVKRNIIFDLSQKIYPEDFTTKRHIESFDEKIWEESDKKSIFYVVSKVAEYKNVEAASRELNFDTQAHFLVWLDELITFLIKEGFEANVNREKYPILPNQNGVFCSKDNLFLDAGDIDEDLKDISKELGHDFREQLLDKSIFLELPENRTYSIVEVSEKISTSIKPILRDVDKRKTYKDTLKKFYLWMNGNKADADTHFPDLFEKRFLFLEDDDISLNMKKATEFDQLMEEHGIKDINDLRSQLNRLRHLQDEPGEEFSEKVNITEEVLASLGITSQEQLNEAFENPEISARFFHTSTPTTEMFVYAQGLIERAKKNIINFLQNHPDYNCDDMEETAPTILAGVLKNNSPVQIVTRPSDNGEVIIYYTSEKDTLDSENAELWVDNAIIDPHILTLGRILKSTGINKIPIKMN